MKWEVCKALGKTINEIKLNDAQWLWCYYNIIEDQEEKNKLYKTMREDLFYIIAPERYFNHKKEEKKEGMRTSADLTKMTDEELEKIFKDMKRYTVAGPIELPSPKIEQKSDNDNDDNDDDMDEIY